MKKVVFLLAVLTLSATSAIADLAAVGPAEISNSWTQDFTLSDTWQIGSIESDWDTFDAMSLSMVTGVLEVPGMTNAEEFSSINQSGTGYLEAYGSNVQNVEFTLNFEGYMDDAVAFDVLVYDLDRHWEGGLFSGHWVYTYEAVGSANAAWDGTGWTIVDTSAWMTAEGLPTGDLSPVPVPAAALLGVLGLGVAGAKLRKRNA